MRREWLKLRDLGASGHVLEWICHGVAVPWLTGAPPPPFNQGVSCRGLPRDQASFLQEEIVRLTLSGVLRPLEYSRGLQERRPHLETNRKRICTSQFERLRVGSCAKQLRRGRRPLGDAIHRGAHHVQGAKGSALHHTAFHPELKGRILLLHEDNQLVIGVLTHRVA